MSTIDPSILAKRPNYIKEEKIESDVTEGTTFAYCSLIQSNSQVLQKKSKKYIKDAQAGDYVIQVKDGESALFKGDQGFTFIPLAHRKRYVGFADMSEGGKWIGNFKTLEEAERKRSSPKDRFNLSIDFLVVVEHYEDNPVVISFNSPKKVIVARELLKHFSDLQTVSGFKYRLRSEDSFVEKINGYVQSYIVEPVNWVSEEERKMLEGFPEASISYFSGEEAKETTLVVM